MWAIQIRNFYLRSVLGCIFLAPFVFPPLPLEVGPLKSSYGVWGNAVSSLSVVWGRVPAEIEFGAF